MHTEQAQPQKLSDHLAAVIRQIAPFVLVFLLVLWAGILLYVLKGKTGSFLWLNPYHSPALDCFFIYLTLLGDGLLAVALSVFCFFILRKNKLGLVMLLSYLLSGLVTQVIKRLVDAPRPLSYFAPGEYLFFIQDITHKANNSFPSGHATTALALAAVLALFSKSRPAQAGWALLGFLVAYSRVFLAQHFLVDILTGACIGFGAAFGVFVFVERHSDRWRWLRWVLERKGPDLL